jgi:hypothetical protein
VCRRRQGNGLFGFREENRLLGLRDGMGLPGLGHDRSWVLRGVGGVSVRADGFTETTQTNTTH